MWGSNTVPSPPGESSLILGDLISHYTSSLFSLMLGSARVYQRCSCVYYLYSRIGLYLGCRHYNFNVQQLVKNFFLLT